MMLYIIYIYIIIRSGSIPLGVVRWPRFLRTAAVLKCRVTSESSASCRWRRLQVHEQQAEREKKSVIQKMLTFCARALELEVEVGSAAFHSLP